METKLTTAGWWELTFAKLFGSRYVSTTVDGTIEAYKWRGKIYVISFIENIVSQMPKLNKPMYMSPQRWSAYLIECRNKGKYFEPQLGGFSVARIPFEEINKK